MAKSGTTAGTAIGGGGVGGASGGGGGGGGASGGGGVGELRSQCARRLRAMVVVGPVMG